MTYTSFPRWVKLRRYCELTGDTPDAVQKKIARGLWLEGNHYATAPDGVRWFNIEAIGKWVENGQSGVPALKSGSKASLCVKASFMLGALH